MDTRLDNNSKIYIEKKNGICKRDIKYKTWANFAHNSPFKQTKNSKIMQFFSGFWTNNFIGKFAI